MVASQGTIAGIPHSTFIRQDLPSELSKINCLSCGSVHQKVLKFCTNCGQSVSQPTPLAQAPVFAQVHGQQDNIIPKELQENMCRLFIAIARERIFLYFHWTVFLSAHCLGLFLAHHLFENFIGDTVSKAVIASTPLFFINLAAFCCLPLIVGTKGEIARLKDRLTYVHYQIEYHNL